MKERKPTRIHETPFFQVYESRPACFRHHRRTAFLDRRLGPTHGNITIRVGTRLSIKGHYMRFMGLSRFYIGFLGQSMAAKHKSRMYFRHEKPDISPPPPPRKAPSPEPVFAGLTAPDQPHIQGSAFVLLFLGLPAGDYSSGTYEKCTGFLDFWSKSPSWKTFFQLFLSLWP